MGKSGSSRKDSSRETGQLMYICTYNTRTLRTDEHLEHLMEELNNFKWDIIGLAETRRAGEGIEEIERGAWLYNRGATELNKEARGIGFLIHPRCKDYIIEIKSYSNRVIALWIQLKGKEKLCIVQVYAPTTDHDDEEVEQFYEDIAKAMEEYKSSYTLVMGDFNAKVGTQQIGEESIMGKFGIGERNKRGDTMIEFAAQHGLVITNTCFKKNINRYWTWESPNGKTRNQIDYIMSNQRAIINNCEVITKVDIASDHRMVRATVTINTKLSRLKFINNKRKKHINLLRLREKHIEFQIKLKNRFDILEDQNKDIDIDTRCKEITNIILEEASSTAPLAKTARDQTESYGIIAELDTKRKKLRDKTDKSDREKAEYADLVKTTRKMRRQRSRKRRDEQIKKVLEAGRGPKEIAKNSRKKSRIQQLRNQDGLLTSNREEILEICSTFYQDLYSSKTEGDLDEERVMSPENSEIPPITQEEVNEAIKQMKKNKAPGIDEITSDIIKEGGKETVTQLVKLYNQIMQERKIPVTWKEAKVILLHKKGDKADIKNYRPISLLSHLYKIFTKILQNRIKTDLDRYQPREQAGFRAGFSTMDHLHTINQLIEKANEYQLDLCIGFIDYEKAFDSVEHKELFKALRKTGINEGYICILEDIYTNAISKIHLDKDVSQIITIDRGVRQGDTLSPKVFTTTMECIFKNIPLDERGINIDGEKLTDLRFADDVALIASSVKDMEVQLNDLNRESKKCGLKMHKGKTKYMTNYETIDTIKIEHSVVEKVDEYKYLGQTLKMSNCTYEEVLRRIKAGWSCFGRHRDILCNKNIPMTWRKRVFNQCVLPTMTYGAETWTTTKKLETKLKTAQRAMERSMLHISLRDKIRCTEIRKRTGVKDIIEKIKEAKWRWAGHVARMDDNRWTRRITDWQPRMGKRRRGRQKRRWRDDLTSYRGTTWIRQAADRKIWKEHEEGYIQQWIDTAYR